MKRTMVIVPSRCEYDYTISLNLVLVWRRSEYVLTTIRQQGATSCKLGNEKVFLI